MKKQRRRPHGSHWTNRDRARGPLGETVTGNYFSDVSFIDPLAWITAVVTLFGVAALANLVLARRASIVDPSVALRGE
jgi:hypothetical protein